jgi:hypothetical protein
MEDKAVKSGKQTNVLATGNDSDNNDDDDDDHEQRQYQQLLRHLEPST